MTENTANVDPLATREPDVAESDPNRTRPGSENASDTRPTTGGLDVRCPHCSAPTQVPADTALSDLTCSACGSHFSLVDQTQETRLAPSLSKMGRFDLIERLGMGAFGSVWKARDKQLDRTVAVKIPRQTAMSVEEQEQFFREARAAAQLRHDNIVSVHEVGRDGDSVYIVSDFVRGVTLGDWLTGQQLTGREAAKLCAKIAGALHHAHEQGVVHRDLKPANIIIDGGGEPHLMDFGLARREFGEVTVTMDGHVLGTPAYMSPEQAEGKAHTADRRSDVYSLGVILFQLLTGELPFRGNARMLLHQVINDEPPSPRKLNANISRDLETITLKCMEKVPARRYQSAHDVAAELSRCQSGEPILARPVSRPEQVFRWVRRNKTVSALSSAVGLALVIAAAGFAVAFARERDLRREVVTQKNEAERQRIDADGQRDNAEAVVKFLTKDVLAKASPRETRDKAVRDALVKTLIEPSAAIVGDRFKDRPLGEAAVRNTLAETLRHLDRPDLALPHAERAMVLRRKVLGESHPDTIDSLNNYAFVLYMLGRSQEAEPLVKQTLDQNCQVLGEDHPVIILSRHNYAILLQSLGRLEEAEPLYKQTLDQNRRMLGEDHPDTIRSLHNYANALYMLGRTLESESLFRHALAQRLKVQGEDHPESIITMIVYAHLLESLGRAHEAEPLYKLALQQYRKVLGDDHPNTVAALADLARATHAAGRHDEAVSLNEQVLQRGFFAKGLSIARSDPEMLNHAIKLAVSRRGEQAPQPIDALILGELRLIAGNFDSAEAAIRAAIQLGGNEHYYQKSLGWCLLAQGKAEQARQAFQLVLKDHRGPDGNYDLENADLDHLTAAYFLDLVPEQQYIDRVSADKKLGTYPWFYVGQRREIEGNKAAAIAAYERCVEPGTAENASTVFALARWRLGKLSDAADGGQE